MQQYAGQTPPEPAPYIPGRTTAWNNRWREIFDHFGQAIMAYARHCGLNEQSAEDVLQEVMTSLIRSQYGQEPGWNSQQCSFKSWIWGVIRNRVRSVRRQDGKEPPVPPASPTEIGQRARPGSLAEAQAPEDFAALEEQRWRQALLAAALRKVQARVSAENFLIYLALLEERATPQELGRIHGKELNAIYAVKHRCERMLADEAKELCAAWEQLQ